MRLIISLKSEELSEKFFVIWLNPTERKKFTYKTADVNCRPCLY